MRNKNEYENEWTQFTFAAANIEPIEFVSVCQRSW